MLGAFFKEKINGDLLVLLYVFSFPCCEICAGVAPAGYLFTCFTKVVQTILDIVGGIFKVINCALHFVAAFAILD